MVSHVGTALPVYALDVYAVLPSRPTDPLTAAQADKNKRHQNSISRRPFSLVNDDGNNTLSVSEACTALEKLTGKSIGSDTVESTCSKCGVDTSREMDCKSCKWPTTHIWDSR
jgi:hypothetical protein